MAARSKLLSFLLVLCMALSVCAEYEILWSDDFSFDTRQSSQVDLKCDDLISYSTGWAEGSGREVEVTASGVTSGDTFVIAELYDDNLTMSNAWDYFLNNADLSEEYILTHTTKCESHVIDTETVRVRLSSSLQDEGTFSGDFNLDTVSTALNATLTLLTTDDIVYDTAWAEGEDKVIRVSAISSETIPQMYTVFESQVDENGTFRWDYLSEEVPSTVAYTLCYEIKNEAGTETYATGSANPVIRILPEPAAGFMMLALVCASALVKRYELN